MLLQMVNGGITNIYSDIDYWSGCETCDYGSRYINEYTIEMTTGTIEIKVEQEYEYALSEGYMMGLILPNIDLIKSMTEEAFFDWIKTEMSNLEVDKINITFDKNVE
jgi:hypothetical protein